MAIYGIFINSPLRSPSLVPPIPPDTNPIPPQIIGREDFFFISTSSHIVFLGRGAIAGLVGFLGIILHVFSFTMEVHKLSLSCCCSSSSSATGEMEEPSTAGGFIRPGYTLSQLNSGYVIQARTGSSLSGVGGTGHRRRARHQTTDLNDKIKSSVIPQQYVKSRFCIDTKTSSVSHIVMVLYTKAVVMVSLRRLTEDIRRP